MSMEVSLLLLLICGAMMGFFGGRMFRDHFLGNKNSQKTGKKLSSAQQKKLKQLQEQLDSGLLTKKEYADRKKELLKNQ